VRLWLILLSILFLFASCQGSDQALSDKLGIQDKSNGPNSPSEVDFSGLKLLRIVQAGSGHQSAVENVSMSIGGTLNIKAALYDLSGNYLTDAPANFTLTNSIFSINDLVVSGDQFSAAFNPSEAGSVIINATYAGSQTNVISPNDSTGSIVVANNQVPNSLQLVAGNNQSAIVSTNLTDYLLVRVLDVDNLPIAGVSVNFSVTVGSGAIQGASSVVTDSNGYASATAKLGSQVGTNNNKYQAVVSGYPNLIAEFQASAVTQLMDFKVLKILRAGVGNQDIMGDASLLVTESVMIKAALFDIAGNYLADAPANFTLSNTTFPSGNLVTAVNKLQATFTPSLPGTVVINASYAGDETNVIASSDSTGMISVTNVQVPASILLSAGNNQSGTVNTNLATPLKVKILDSFNQPIPGVSVLFQVTQGSGSIIGSNPVFTDIDGFASVTVKVGTISGGNNNQFRALVSDIPTLLTDFQANALAGPQHHITFTTQPAILFASVAFGVQPVVELRDEFNNLVVANGTITMSKAAGTGTVGGTTTATMTNGVATFSNLSWNTAESGVILHASNGSVFGLSSSLTITSPPPGACAVNDSAFTTADGGCKDIATGLVWSQPSGTSYTWTNIVWDNLVAGAPLMDAYDYGRGNDYVENVISEECGAFCDTSSIAYCKPLDEGGKIDWRVPTRSELAQLYSNGASGHLAGTLARFYSSSSSASESAYAIRLSDGLQATIRKSDNYNFTLGGVSSTYPICVRSSRPSASTLSVISGPAFVGIGQAPHSYFPLQIAVRDSVGARVNASGRTVTLSATSLGSIGGTIAVATDKSGLATFNNFNLNTAGIATITISSPGLASVTFTLTVKNEVLGVPCLTEDSFFQTTLGGCKDMTSGLVWSSLGASSIATWYSVVWDNSLAGAPVQDLGDFNRSNDYSDNAAEDCGIYCDNSTNTSHAASLSSLGYCKSLTEGGKSDWRVPTRAEIQSLQSNGGSNYLPGITSRLYWTSSSNITDKTYAYSLRLSDGLLTGTRKYDSYTPSNLGSTYPICVRGGRSNASKLNVVTAPTIIGINADPPSAFQVRVLDDQNNFVFGSGITLSVSSTNANVSGTLTALTNYQGIATFSTFQLDSIGIKNLTFSASGLTGVSVNVEVRQGVTPGSHICASENIRFKSQFGGCHDSDTDLAWSTSSTSAMTWYQAVWDSLTAGSQGQDSGDYARTNDYDSILPPSSGNEDTSASAYCKSLIEGGYSDWRLPTIADWEYVRIGNMARTYFAQNTIIPTTGGQGSGCYWSSSSVGADKTQAFYVGLWGSGSTTAYTLKTNSTLSYGVGCDGQSSLKNIRVICVRDNSP
jgi:hypothetical protein